MDSNLILSFLASPVSSRAPSARLPCCYPTAAVQQLISASIKAPLHMCVQSVGAQPSRHSSEHMWTRPACTFPAVLATGVTSPHVIGLLNHCYTSHDSTLLIFFIIFFLTFLFTRCSSCLVVFGGLNSVKSHIQQAHCDMFHKCPSCPMAFKSAPSIQNHITAQHPGLPEGQPMYVQHTV